MHEGFARGRAAAQDNRVARSREPRPDRLALWAVFLCLFALAVGAASAHAASSGGIGTGGSTTPDAAPFGTRVLTQGMEGADVKILHGIVKSKPYAGSVRLNEVF